jgi:hypothetical protein
LRLHTSLFGLITLLAPCALWAGNPHILIKDPPGTPVILTTDSFTFGADSLGGGLLTFQNESGTNWTELELSAVLPDFTTITCGPGPFVTCTIAESPVNNGFLYNILFGPAVGGGITQGQIFTVNLNDEGEDPNGTGSWPAGADFNAQASTVTPEPSAITLILFGGVLLAGFCYRRRSSVV